MPTNYECDHCGKIAQSLAGWLLIAVQFYSMNPSVPDPPGGRTLDATSPDLLFDTLECRDAWLTAKGFSTPPGAA